MKKLRSNYFLLIIVISALIFIIPGYQSSNERLDTTNYPVPGKMIDIGTHKLHLNCTGSGSPTIILEHGMGANSLDWRVIQEELSRKSKVCAYDRSGYGWSEAAESPRTADQLVSELNQLIVISGLQPPFILVAHSFGGVVATGYASEYPENIAAMILVDAIYPGMFSKNQDLFEQTPLRSTFWKRLFDTLILYSRVGAIRALIPLNIVPWTQTPDNLPTDLEELRRATQSVANHWLTFESEMAYMQENIENYSAEKMEGIVDNKPLYVFYGSESAPIPINPGSQNDPENVWESLQTEWQVISSDCQIIEVQGANHNSILLNPKDFRPILLAVSEIQARIKSP